MPEYQRVLLPTSYFPPVDYFAHLAKGKKAVVEHWETYPKQTYRNRCEVVSSQGIITLVVPVSKPNGNHTLTRDIEICYREPWQGHHWKTIRSCYGSSPYFGYYAEHFETLFTGREQLLTALNSKALGLIAGILKLSINIGTTEIYEKNPENTYDLRRRFSPKKNRPGDLPPYAQVFGHIHGFVPGLSILDLIFNLGPDAKSYLQSIKID